MGIHVDFNHNDDLQLYRRINVLVYLNEDWDESCGGHFQLWSDTSGTERKKILPLFNRMTIFSITADSFHGHPEPLTCPPDRCRRSLALYYYTADKGEKANFNHSTVFVNEKGKKEEPGKETLTRKIKNKIKKILGR